MTIYFVLGLFSFVYGLDCPNYMSSEYARELSRKTIWFRFSAKTTFAQVLFLNKPILTVDYSAAEPNILFKENGYETVGDLKNAQIGLDIISINTSTSGLYLAFITVTPTSYIIQCTTVYKLGVPSRPTISGIAASVGSNASLTCFSSSTTYPSGHNLALKYNWKVNDTDIFSNSKYSFSTESQSTLTISNIVKDDAAKQFTCTARELVSDGYTSLSSDTTNLNVVYGPETMLFSPSDEEYEREENTDFGDVRCQANCNPSCSFRWTKSGDMSINISADVLRLGKLSSAQAGIYTCTATRSGFVSQTKNLTVNVIYGPRNIGISPNDSSGSVRQDEDSYLLPRTCSAQCWLCGFAWTGPNGYSYNNSSLIVGPLKRSNHGTYTCTATNMKVSSRQQTSRVLIEVRYGPDAAKLSPNSTSYIVDEMTRLSDIVCSADCFPTCTYRWTKQGQSIALSTTDTLELGIVQKNYSGNYTCTATNTDFSTKKAVQSFVEVKIRYGPYQESTIISPSDPKQTVKEGYPLSNINCQADCFPACTFSWNKQGTGLVLSGSGLLSIGTVNRSDAGVYICTATNSGKHLPTTASITVEIIVNYGPDTANVSVSRLYEVTEGHNVPDIVCSSDCFPDCFLTWKNSNGTVSSNGKLSLGKVTRQQAGIYTCTSINNANDAKTASQTIQLVVKYAPVVSIGINSSKVAEKSSLILTCEGAGVPASYSYTGLTQTVGSIEIPNTNAAKQGTSKNSNIQFSSLQLQDTGTYTCLLNNGIQDQFGRLDQSASLNLTVLVVPKVLSSESVFAAATDSSVTINVPFYCYPAVISIQFAKLNNTKIVNGAKYNISVNNSTVYDNFYGKVVALDGYQASLTIASLEEPDFGTYQLNITNDQGATSFPFVINAESPPTVPSHFIYSSELYRQILIWTKEFNGGHLQTFTIETAIPDSGMWNNMVNISENDARHKINESVYFANITGLNAGTYTARLTAWNSIGKAEPLYLNSSFTIASDVTDSEKHTTTTAAIVGGIVSAVVVLVIVAVILIIFKRRAGNKDKETSHLQLKKHGNVQGEDNNSDEDETIENPMYDRGPQQPVYSTPDKKKNQKEVKLGDVYATVDKSKKSENNKLKKANPKKKKQIAQGDIYENVAEKSTIGNNSYGNAAFEDNTYENPEGSKPSKTPKKNINPDGLIYADLAFNDQPKGQKKLVIHGLDEMTTYVQVDFTKKADPLPDSDTEEQSTNKKN